MPPGVPWQRSGPVIPLAILRSDAVPRPISVNFRLGAPGSPDSQNSLDTHEGSLSTVVSIGQEPNGCDWLFKREVTSQSLTPVRI